MSTFVSLFAGVGGFDLGLEQAGHTCVGQVEIDKYAQKVLKKHWPDVPLHNDVTTAIDWAKENDLIGRVDIVCGGFPCQDVSVAGKRAGIAGARSGLFWDAIQFAREVKAQTIILENVPGLLSSNQGRDFGIVLSAMADAGYGHIEWRVLDSQFFGVPQRRRRVFIVGSVIDRSKSPIFIEPESKSGYFKKVKKQRKRITTATPISLGNDGERKISNTISAELYHHGSVVNQDVSNGHLIVFDPHRSDGARIQGDTINTLTSVMGTGGNNTPMVAYSMHGGMVGRQDKNGPSGSGFQDENEPSYTLTSSSQAIHGVVTINENNHLVRRLTPVECERLQGFPDNWTDGQADSHRYKQMGNAVTVNVIKWIGSRL